MPCVLKIAEAEHNAIDEALALEAWNGNGAVRLLEADREHGALLLERLDPDRTLRTTELATAAEISRQPDLRTRGTGAGWIAASH